MAISAEVLAVERPSSTRVKQSGNRYLVIKRTSKRVNGKVVPLELGTIGEIIDGQYVELRKTPRKKETRLISRTMAKPLYFIGLLVTCFRN